MKIIQQEETTVLDFSGTLILFKNQSAVLIHGTSPAGLIIQNGNFWGMPNGLFRQLRQLWLIWKWIRKQAREGM